MIVVLLATILLTIIILILSSASYLISLLCGESDDADLSESYALDFGTIAGTSAGPSTSSLGPICINPRHHHHYDEDDDRLETVLESFRSDGLETPPATLGKSNSGQINPSPRQSPPDSVGIETILSLSSEQTSPGLDEAAWSKPPQEQKNTIMSQLGAPASKPLFDDFDPREMQNGGTVLHWCKSKKSVDKLVKLGIPLNYRNNRQETPVHVAIRKRRLPVLVGLLVNGANVEGKNENGETPLILAARMIEIFAFQLLLVYDANVNAIDNANLSARHYLASYCDKNKAQPQTPNPGHVMLAMLNELGAKRCPPMNVASLAEGHIENRKEKLATSHRLICAPGCSSSGTYDGNSYNRWPSYQNESMYKRHMFSDIIEESRKVACSPRSPADWPVEDKSCKSNADQSRKIEQSRLLCIDGGGMRGVIVCQMLIELQKYLKRPVISYFDWIGGTSVGAFLACALCCGVSLIDLRRISFDVKDEVFSGNRPYNSKFLERVLKRTYGPNTRMWDVTDRKLIVTTVIADREPCQLRLFRNYKSAGQLLEYHGYSAQVYDSVSGQPVLGAKRTKSKDLKSTVSDHFDAATIGSTFKQVGEAETSAVHPVNKSIISGAETKKSPRKVSQDTICDKKKANSTKLDSKSGESTLMEPALDESDQNPLMWQAVRASAAAPFFFKPYGPFLDGGIIANNPTLDMMTEFHNHEKVKSFLRARANQTSDIRSQKENVKLFDGPKTLGLVLSLGTGRGRVVSHQAILDFGQVAAGFSTVFSPVELVRSIRAAKDLFKKVMQQSCQTEDHILDRAQAWCSSLRVPYFRVNPPLATIFSIDDKRDEQLINALWQAKLYMRAMRPQLEELGELLDSSSIDAATVTSPGGSSSFSDSRYGNFSDSRSSDVDSRVSDSAESNLSNVSIIDRASHASSYIN